LSTQTLRVGGFKAKSRTGSRHSKAFPCEDCLYLNVWTTAATAKKRRPVMLWIQGGGLTNGMSWQNLSYGTKLAPEGVVLVTIAYRLG
jgi:para-nitrobenzyl esterase